MHILVINSKLLVALFEHLEVPLCGHHRVGRLLLLFRFIVRTVFVARVIVVCICISLRCLLLVVILNEIGCSFVNREIGQMDKLVQQLIWVVCILLSCKPNQAIIIDVDFERVEACN